MAASSRNIAAGNAYTFLGFLDEFGFLKGSTTTAPSNGSSTNGGMARLFGVKTVPLAIQENETVPITGDDTKLGDFQFEPLGVQSYIIEFSVDDIDLAAQMTGTTVTTFGGAKGAIIDTSSVPERDICLIHQSRAKKQDSGVKGSAAWEVYVILKATAKYLGRNGFTERGAAVYRLQITPQLSGYYPWGITIADAVDGAPDGRVVKYNAEYPITMHRMTGDAATAVITVDYSPVSTALSAAVSNRVSAAITSVSSASKTITLTSNPAGAAKVVAWYQFTE